MICVNLPDAKKGEKVIALVQGVSDIDALRKSLINSGMSPLNLPAEFYSVETIPKLGTGKSDFTRAKQIALEYSSAHK